MGNLPFHCMHMPFYTLHSHRCATYQHVFRQPAQSRAQTEVCSCDGLQLLCLPDSGYTMFMLTQWYFTNHIPCIQLIQLQMHCIVILWLSHQITHLLEVKRLAFTFSTEQNINAVYQKSSGTFVSLPTRNTKGPVCYCKFGFFLSPSCVRSSYLPYLEKVTQ